MIQNKNIDFIKTILAILVIIVHTLPVNDKTFWINNGICRIAVPFFFFVSGYYSFKILNKKISFKKFMIFISPYVISFIIWMIIYSYYAYKKIFIHITYDNIYAYICKLYYIFFYKEGYFHLWYMLATIYGFIVIYLLKRININEKAITLLALTCYVAGVFSTTYANYLTSLNLLLSIIRYIGYPITFAFPLLFIGYLVHKYEDSILKYCTNKLFICIIILYCIEFILIWIKYTEHKYFDMYITHIILIPLLFIQAKNWNIPIINHISSRYITCSGEMYFIHPLIISLLSLLNSNTNIIFIIGVTFISSYIIHPYLYRSYRIFKQNGL